MARDFYDLLVRWQRPDGTTVDLPACLAYDEDTAESRAKTIGEAIECNAADFPDDLPDGSLPISVKFSEAT